MLRNTSAVCSTGGASYCRASPARICAAMSGGMSGGDATSRNASKRSSRASSSTGPLDLAGFIARCPESSRDSRARRNGPPFSVVPKRELEELSIVDIWLQFPPTASPESASYLRSLRRTTPRRAVQTACRAPCALYSPKASRHRRRFAAPRCGDPSAAAPVARVRKVQHRPRRRRPPRRRSTRTTSSAWM